MALPFRQISEEDIKTSLLPPLKVITRNITSTEYNTIEQAYKYFNEKLWHKNPLPEVIITLQHHKKYGGYFWQDKFTCRNSDTETKIGEVALNPDLFIGKDDKYILAILVHEMCHVWQAAYGKQVRKGYHDKQWGSEMKRIGLHPSATGQAGGKETGSSMSHYIIPRHSFDILCDELLEQGFKLNWQSFIAQGKAAKKATRAKFVCPDCKLQAMAKPTAKLSCYQCSEETGNNVEMICTIQNDEGESDND
jgi:predicted SprT family Zn-dependent metalloprotease